MRCLVTGASGHIGSFLTKKLLARGCDVAVLVQPQSDLWRLADVLDQITLLPGSLGDLQAIRAPLQRWAPEALFHLAWHGVTAGFRNDPSQITRNVTGSLELQELAWEAGCRSWIGVGSQAEYGPYNGILHEELPTHPTTAYGVAKLALGMLTEKLCALSESRFVWLRLLAAYGPMDDSRHLIPAVITQLLDGRRPALTAGEQRWDYLYIDDAVEAICRLVLETDACGVFNLGSGAAVTVRHLVETARDFIDPTLPLGFGEIPYPPGQVMHLQSDITKLQAATGWSPQTSTEEGLRQTVDWHRAVRSGTKKVSVL